MQCFLLHKKLFNGQLAAACQRKAGTFQCKCGASASLNVEGSSDRETCHRPRHSAMDRFTVHAHTETPRITTSIATKTRRPSTRRCAARPSCRHLPARREAIERRLQPRRPSATTKARTEYIWRSKQEAEDTVRPQSTRDSTTPSANPPSYESSFVFDMDRSTRFPFADMYKQPQPWVKFMYNEVSNTQTLRYCYWSTTPAAARPPGKNSYIRGRSYLASILAPNYPNWRRGTTPEIATCHVLAENTSLHRRYRGLG